MPTLLPIAMPWKAIPEQTMHEREGHAFDNGILMTYNVLAQSSWVLQP